MPIEVRIIESDFWCRGHKKYKTKESCVLHARRLWWFEDYVGYEFNLYEDTILRNIQLFHYAEICNFTCSIVPITIKTKLHHLWLRIHYEIHRLLPLFVDLILTLYFWSAWEWAASLSTSLPTKPISFSINVSTNFESVTLFPQSP